MGKVRNSSSAIRADKYVEFVKTVHLISLGMDAASFQIDRASFAVLSSGGNLPVLISGKHDLVKPQPRSFSVRGQYNVSVKGAGNTDALSINCTYTASFSIEGETDDSMIQRFAENEVRLVFWPYLRHFIADITFRMSINPLLLPLTSEIQAAQ